ncbi:hypothetical protein V8F33_000472 [Rhypophila sp. PSN 637]
MPKARLRRLSPILSPTPSPGPTRESSPTPSSVFENSDRVSIMSTSRPASLAIPPHPPTSPPSLREILTNSAPPPYTLSAFMAFLSQNHCLETLEFTMDAERYKNSYNETLREQSAWAGDVTERVCSLWLKLMRAYIVPYGPREVNLPAHVRDRLLSLPSSPTPPQPSELDEAVSIVYELMNDSVLGPFLESVAPPPQEYMEDDGFDTRSGRLRLRTPKDPASSSSSTHEDPSRSPKTGFLPLLSIGWSSDPINRTGSTSSEQAEREAGLSDDAASSGSPAANEPMTPPTTPPTSDWAFSTSPGSLHRAISAHNNGWKKMGAKLGLGRKNRSKRSNTTSATSAAADVVPIPNTPSATSLEKLSIVKTENETVEIAAPSARQSGEWEEPHPGQPLALPVKANTCCGVSQQIGSGVQGIGMAAKGYSPYPVRGLGVGTGIRRLSRPKLRTSVRPHKALQDGGNRSMTTHSLQSNNSSVRPLVEAPVSQTFPVEFAKRPLKIDPVFEMDSEKELDGLGSDAMDTATPSESSSPRLSMIDYSSRLNVAIEDGNDYLSMSLEPIVYSHDSRELADVSPDEDRYGWEAELGQKFCSPTTIQYRRTGGAKRSLLHRVFHLSARQPS